MSKTLKTIYYLVLGFVLVFQTLTDSHAQTVETKIKITETNVFIEGSFKDGETAKNVTNFSFIKSYAAVENLGARVSDVNLFGRNGQKINYKKLTDGEFLADAVFGAWNYRINLSPPSGVSALAHVSWVSNEQGILMLGDLLPESAEKNGGKVTLELPAGWRVASAEKRLGANVFEVAELEKAVFYIGKNWREKEIAAGSAKLDFVIAGEWQVTDDEALETARAIFLFYEKLFGARSFERALIFLGKFPPGTKNGRWEAETRGRSVTIFSSEMNFKTQSLQRLHEQLRHELFHFWFPNGVNLAGNYDWFYEGFALYQALRAAVAMNQIRFDDFLDTLARAHSIDSLQGRKVSLIEASKNRWNGANTQVYARGMLVAFLVDSALLQKSKGKNSLADILRELYRRHNISAPRADGNAAVLNVLEARPELRAIVEKYIKAAENIDWQTDLASIGIESATENFITKLKVKTDLSGREKDLLDKLGYNNWRKNSESSK
jgi:hypothetical protein